jgi:hypothetical protein
VALIEDHVELDVTDALRKEGVDVDGQIRLSEGNWDGGVFVVQAADGSEVRMTEAEVQERWKKCLGPFTMEVGTLVGEISFRGGFDVGRKNVVQFSAPVYLVNKNRMGIPRPPTYKYDSAFASQGTNYQRRVQISHSLEPGEADRFTVRLAVEQSSFHRFRATLRDVSGLIWQSVPIEMHCFVPRSRRKRVEEAIARDDVQDKPK